MESKLWGGRFSESTSQTLEQLNSSIGLDKRLFAEDIEGSKAYAKSLQLIDLLTKNELHEICKGLDIIKTEWSKNKFIIKDGDEDIHTANERRLKELIGEPATKLHVGRSRNDQVITDMKLWMKNHLTVLDGCLKSLISVMIARASQEIDIIMPGYTHLQRAQPIRWSHYLLSHTWNLKKDSDCLKNIMKLVNVMPLGSGAIAGNPFQIDRVNLANLLQFDDITQNSMQAVSDRDFVADFLFWASLNGIHLSRLAEDLIIYSSKEFGFIQVHDSYSTGSSLMPQKRNPDSLELIRGIGGSLFGQCCSFMMVLKGLPTTYNKDLQSDKELLFGTYDKLKLILEVATGTLQTLKVYSDNCKNALSFDMLATDLAYYLVKKGVPFREAHHIAGRVVSESEQSNIPLKDLTISKLKEISKHFDEDVVNIWNYEHSIEQYQAEGGSSKNSVLKQIDHLKNWLKDNSKQS